jgi:hypothetical protein
VIDVDAQAQTAHLIRKIRLIAANRTHPINLSKSETNKIVNRRCYFERSESQTVSATTANNTDRRCFAQPVLSEAEGLNMTEPMRAELQVVKCAGRIDELDSNDRWGLAY